MPYPFARGAVASLALLVIIVLGGCSAAAPAWRPQALALMDELDRQGARTLYPQEYRAVLETFENGEAVLNVKGDEQEADRFYLLTLKDGAVLREELQNYRQRLAEEQSRRELAEAARVEEERLQLQAAEAEARIREQEQRAAEVEAQGTAARKQSLKELPPVLLNRYTVRRGETLPQIAARTEIYNDASLWPLIYRANRDQIRDPKQLWPGQVLKIPRQFSRDELLEAKRYSGKK